MNIEVVKNVFGAVVPTSSIKTEKNIVPVILLIAVVGIGVIIYNEHKKLL